MAAMKPARVEETLTLLEREGVNHIDTAAGYGDSELNLAGWLGQHRSEIFLATKTAERGGNEARAGLERSLARMGGDQILPARTCRTMVSGAVKRPVLTTGFVVTCLTQRTYSSSAPVFT